MADPVTLLIVGTLVSTTAGIHAQKSAENAANAQSKSQQNLLERRKEDQRQALVENSKRQQRNKERQLAQVRASQAASGFNTESGTSLAIFGEIETRIDENINEQTSRALDGLGQLQSQKDQLAFGDELRSQAGSTQRLAVGIQGATQFASGYTSNYDRTGSDVFGIFN